MCTAVQCWKAKKGAAWRLEFLAGIWPKEHLHLLAPRAALQCEGSALQKLIRLDTERLKTSDDKGVRLIVQTLGGVGGKTLLEDRYEKFEKALFGTSQRQDESNESYLARHEILFEDLLGQNVSLTDVRSYILLRNSALSSEDKKKVIVDARGDLKYEAVTSAIRLLGSKFFGEVHGQAKSTKKQYEVNYAQDNEEEIQTLDEQVFVSDGMELPEQLLEQFAAEGDEDALVVHQFEESLIDFLQGDEEMSILLTAYADARRRLAEKSKGRGFWPIKGSKGKGKSKFQKFRKPLSQRIAESECRICGRRGHWKRECPFKNSGPTAMGSSKPQSANALVLDGDDDGDLLIDIPPPDPSELETQDRHFVGAVIDTEDQSIYFKRLQCSVPLSLTDRKLFTLDISEMIEIAKDTKFTRSVKIDALNKPQPVFLTESHKDQSNPKESSCNETTKHKSEISNSVDTIHDEVPISSQDLSGEGRPCFAANPNVTTSSANRPPIMSLSLAQRFEKVRKSQDEAEKQVDLEKVSFEDLQNRTIQYTEIMEAKSGLETTAAYPKEDSGRTAGSSDRVDDTKASQGKPPHDRGGRGGLRLGCGDISAGHQGRECIHPEPPVSNGDSHAAHDASPEPDSATTVAATAQGVSNPDLPSASALTCLSEHVFNTQSKKDNWVLSEMWNYLDSKGFFQKDPRWIQKDNCEVLEVYCSSDSQLTKQCLLNGGRAHRFGLKQGDLQYFENRCKLYDLLMSSRPGHVWVAPRCTAWCKWNQFNMQLSVELAEKIMRAREEDEVHLLLCAALYEFQCWRGSRKHFHLEQPNGSDMLYQPELQVVYDNLECCRCDQCVAGNLIHPEYKTPIQKGMQILTTSKIMSRFLGQFKCPKNHHHHPIAGSVKTSQGRISLSQYTELYTHVFAKRVVRAMQAITQVHEEQVTPQACILHNEDASDLVDEPESKRRRLLVKQERPPEYPEPPARDSSVTESSSEKAEEVTLEKWMSDALEAAPRVGKKVIQEGPLFQQASDLFPEVTLRCLELCKGTDRFRKPPIPLMPGEAPC
eukprot:symbB.v1.2.038338.t1/scaffold5931.1/size27163/1